MAATQSYDSTTIREDLSDLIANISPSETPMLSAARVRTATNTTHGWVEDTLAAPDSTNAAQEGQDGIIGNRGTGTRLENTCQISTKVYGVSGTMESVNSAGFDSAIAYASAKAARELKTDVDSVVAGTNQTKVTAASGTAPKTASLSCWVRAADRDTTTGADPTPDFDGSNADTESSSVRSFSQSILDNVIQEAWDNGGRPSLIITGPTQRTTFSTFDGLGNEVTASTMRTDRAGKTIVGTADVYMSNFGDLSIVTSRHMRKAGTIDRDAWLIDGEHLAVAYLRPWQEFDLSKTGDSVNRQMVVEYALEVSNTYAHGLCADLGA